MTNPLVSVIITTYNHEDYIRRALNSVLMQKTSFEYEILIGDDASTDDTPNILNEYIKDPRIQIFFRQQNIGANRNSYELLTISKGKYIASLDGDDFWISDEKLQKQVFFLESNSSYVGCTTKSVCVDENNNELFGVDIPWVCKKRDFGLKDFDGIHLPGQTSSVVKRNFFNDAKHDMSIIYKTHPNLGDRFSVFLYLCEGDFYCIDECLSAYRLHSKNDNNLTNKLSGNVRLRIETDFILTDTMEKYARDNELQVDFEKLKQRLFGDAIWNYVRADGDEYKILMLRIWEKIDKKKLGFAFAYDILVKQIGVHGLIKYIKKVVKKK